MDFLAMVAYPSYFLTKCLAFWNVEQLPWPSESTGSGRFGLRFFYFGIFRIFTEVQEGKKQFFTQLLGRKFLYIFFRQYSPISDGFLCMYGSIEERFHHFRDVSAVVVHEAEKVAPVLRTFTVIGSVMRDELLEVPMEHIDRLLERMHFPREAILPYECFMWLFSVIDRRCV